PLFASLVLGALPVAEFGDDEQRSRLLGGVAGGDTVLTAAFTAGTDLRADPAGDDGWRVRGRAETVPYADAAHRVLASARTEEGGTVVFVTDPAGASKERQETTTGEPAFRLEIETVVGAADVVAEPSRGAAVVAWTTARALAALSV